MINRQSIEAFHEIRRDGTLGAMQEEVLSLIRLHPGKTARELAELGCHADPNAVRPRIVELRQAGLIEEAGVRICSVSGKGSATWKLRVYDPQRRLFE